MPIDQDMRSNRRRAGAGAGDVSGARRRRASGALLDPKPSGARVGRFSGSPRRAGDANLSHHDVLHSRSCAKRRGGGLLRIYCIGPIVSEAQFTVMGGEVPAPDAIASMTGIPAAAIVQDTQIVTNFIGSRAAVEKLETNVDLRGLYSRDAIDILARFNPAKPIEKLVSYWRHMSEVSIIMPAGIVDLKGPGLHPGRRPGDWEQRSRSSASN